MDYNLLKTFVKVAELGSFTQAAKSLKQPKSRVSRAIARLEAELDIQLVKRTTRKTSLTGSGVDFYKNISSELKSINEELERIKDTKDEMSGKIRITSSETLAQTILPKIIKRFNDRYPRVQIEALITTEFVDMVEEDIDIAFRAGKLADSSLMQAKLADASFIFVASPRYIEKRKMPMDLSELKDHDVLLAKSIEDEIKKSAPDLRVRFLSNSFPMLLRMALNDEGITILPEFLFDRYLEQKELVRVLPELNYKSGSLKLVYLSGANTSKRVKEFIRISKEFFKQL